MKYKNLEKDFEEMEIDSTNLIKALDKLTDLLHAHGLDKEAIEALKECGIKLVIEVEGNGKN